MVENEKAAFYAGWEPDTKCAGSLKSSPPAIGDFFCSVCGFKWNASVLPIHNAWVPNMYDSYNWMKALEKLVERDTIYLAFDSEGAICSFMDLEIDVEAEDMDHAVVGALAALYDKEHPE